MSKKKELLLRAYIVLAMLVLVALLLIGSTVRISVIERSTWTEKGDSTKLEFVDIEPERGNIYSNDGRLLATSVPYFDLHIDLNSEPMTDRIFNQHVDSLAIYLSKYVFKKESSSKVRRRLVRSRKAGNRYFLIKNNATYAELTRIKNFPLIRLGKYQGGLIVERKSRRLKPFKNLASRTIGLDRDNAQSVGLEGAFDKYLRGAVGKRLMQRVGNGIWIPVRDLSEIQPERGQDVLTNLDMRMQDISQTALRDALVRHDADFGLAVMMEVKTGAIRALVNLHKEPSTGNYWESYNHAVADATEPGSTFKLPAVMALLEDGFADITDSVNINHGRAKFGRFVMQDAHWRKETNVSIKRAFEISSNVGIAKVIDDYYGVGDNAEKFIKRLKKFGLHQKTGIEIKGEGEPQIKDLDHPTWNKIMTLPWMAHGYELELTPIQTLAFYNAVANDGRKMKPYLVSKIMQGSKTIQSFEPEVLMPKIASRETIGKARELLLGVVENGTGKNIKSSHYSFAGKSGTTKLEYWKGEDSKYQASFVGYFPAEKPRYSCIVMVTNPKREGYYGGTVAGAVFKEISDRCMGTDVSLMAYNDNPAEDLPNSLPFFEVGYAPDLLKVLTDVSMQFENRSTSDWAITMPTEEEGLVVKNRNVENDLVPNVVGMGLRDAIFILENIGLKVKINGSGKVRDQSLAPGTKLNNQKILLYLG